MKNRIFLIIIMVLTFNSCGIFKTHHKDKLIDFENNKIPQKTLKLNGYYFAELEREAQSFDKIQGDKIKCLSAFFIYEDGFVVNIRGIDGITNYTCAQGKTFENSYESAHKAIELMLESQNSEEKRTKRICEFKPNDIGNKGLAKINSDRIKIQFYSIEMQKPGKDSFNSAYLYEMNGVIKSDLSFVIENETEYRTNKTTTENTIFRFRQTEQKPNIENYFKKNINRFK
ncbi:hypothetical protein [Tenacibaculum sp. 47A_GOM-205m]|uniref:hypothetical protein n=1 Tax=Tenacibaculum sp. 47A_GOM-205m TaxID=1380384 RepID=UPI0012DE5AE3|nr:hypothetical protein [Tenacibaculum sp. 47A_GOM-205m]